MPALLSSFGVGYLGSQLKKSVIKYFVGLNRYTRGWDWGNSKDISVTTVVMKY